jgi:AcrR family transcriptional regulator
MSEGSVSEARNAAVKLADSDDAAPRSATRGRGRPPTTARAIERKRQEIIEAAFDVIAEKGYHATGIADIAERLDIGHGTFYRYFSNKRDILDHVFDYGAIQFMEAMSLDEIDAATTIDELRELLTQLGHRLFTEFLDADPRLPRMLLLEVGSIDSDLLMRVLGLLETTVALLTPVVRNAADRGLVRSDIDVQSVARALHGCMLGAFFANLRSPMSETERSNYIETVVSLICDNHAPLKPGKRTRK